MALHALHLCSGYGGFELALRLAGIPARTVCHVERDAHAAAALVARMEDEALDRAPIWDDIETFDGRAWRGRVDIVTAGFPCQPFSAAGQRRGTEDERWLWPDIARIVRDVGPEYVLLENVTQLVRYGLPYVLSDLAALGFDAEWGCLPASAVGAPHRRERWWCLAWMADAAGVGRQADHPAHAAGPPRLARPSHGSGAVADADSQRGVAGDGTTSEIQRVWGAGIQSVRRGLGWPPHRDDTDGWRQWIDAGGPQPVLRGDANGARRRMDRPREIADRLHLGGNGLVPQCAAEAFRRLWERR